MLYLQFFLLNYLDNKSYDKQRQKLDEIYAKVLEEGYKVNKW